MIEALWWGESSFVINIIIFLFEDDCFGIILEIVKDSEKISFKEIPGTTIEKTQPVFF